MEGMFDYIISKAYATPDTKDERYARQPLYTASCIPYSAWQVIARYCRRMGVGFQYTTPDKQRSPLYSGWEDTIKVFTAPYYPSGLAFAQTIFHELAHSTGHESRLARWGIVNLNFLDSLFFSPLYCYEECVAETAAFIALNQSVLIPAHEANESFSYLGTFLRRAAKGGKEVDKVGLYRDVLHAVGMLRGGA